MNSRRVVLFGAAALGAYLAVALATLALSGRRLLPLFEGVGPPPAYQWVNPPPAFSSGNTKPRAAGIDIAIAGGRSSQAAASTADGQFVVNFNANALPAHDADTSVHAEVTPIDPATLGPVPSGLAADGNAYRVQLTNQPSNTPLDTVTGQADIALTAPNPGNVLLYSSDGKSWSKLAAQTVGATSTVISTFKRPGWYLVGANPSADLAGKHNNLLRTVVIAVLVGGLAVALAATPARRQAFRRRWSRRRT